MMKFPTKHSKPWATKPALHYSETYPTHALVIVPLSEWAKQWYPGNQDSENGDFQLMRNCCSKSNACLCGKRDCLVGIFK